MKTNRVQTMNPVWQEWLQSTGAQVDDGIVQHFGDPRGELEATGSAAVLADLSHLGLIDCVGPESEVFLQGQLSCDLQEIGANASGYCSHCTPKGRMIASFLIWRIPAGESPQFRMALSRSILAPAMKRLGMYVLRSKVKLSDVSDSVTLLGVAGDEHATASDPMFAGLSPHETRQLEGGGTVIALSQGRFVIAVPVEGARAMWSKLAATRRPVGTPCWEWLDIRNGIPFIAAGTQEQFLPQMTNLELLGGVSFKKGCYTGQEVVARTQHLGKVKRRMHLAHLDLSEDAPRPCPGDETYSDDIPGQASGMVVSAQNAPGGGYDLLAVVHQSSRESSIVRWRSADGPVLRFADLPYEVG